MSKERTRILVVDDEEIVRESLSGWLAKDGYTLATAPRRPDRAGDAAAQGRWSILLVDLKMPGMDGLQVLEAAKQAQPDVAVVIMTAYATVETAVEAMKTGAYDYLVKPFDPEELSLMMVKIVAQQALVRENVLLRKVLKRDYHFRDMVSKNPAMHRMFDLAQERGAQPVDDPDPRRERHRQGAARARDPRREPPPGRALRRRVVRGAHRDAARVGALRPREGRRSPAPWRGARASSSWPTAARCSSTRSATSARSSSSTCCASSRSASFVRVGGTEPVDVDVRIIAATNRDLKKAVADGQFREDLFYRLNVIPILLPPLRERREDIPLLVEHFLERLSVETNRQIEGVSRRRARRCSMRHDWPGNVRELRNVLERGMVVAKDTHDPARRPRPARRRASGPRRTTRALTLDEVERRHITAVLQHAGGNVTQAARTLGHRPRDALQQDPEVRAAPRRRRRVQRIGAAIACARGSRWRATTPPSGPRASRDEAAAGARGACPPTPCPGGRRRSSSRGPGRARCRPRRRVADPSSWWNGSNSSGSGPRQSPAPVSATQMRTRSPDALGAGRRCARRPA